MRLVSSNVGRFWVIAWSRWWLLDCNVPPQQCPSSDPEAAVQFLPPESLFTINVGRSRSVARFCVDVRPTSYRLQPVLQPASLHVLVRALARRVQGPKQVALLLSALCGISLPSQSFESLSHLESGCLDAIREVDGASGGGGAQPDAMVWDGARVRSRESFGSSGGHVPATEVTQMCAPTHSGAFA